MSDAFTDRNPLAGFETKPKKSGEKDFNAVRDLFLYGLYRYVADPTAADSKAKVLAAAKLLAKLRPSSYSGFWKRVRLQIPLLIREAGNEDVWADLLLCMGRDNHMFKQFVDISPFSGKTLLFCEFLDSNRFNQNPTPDLSSLWQPKIEDNGSSPSRLVIVGPAKANLSVFSFR